MIILVSYENVSGEILQNLSEPLTTIFGQAVESITGNNLKQSAWRVERQQYNADTLLDAIPSPPAGGRVLGIMDSDIFALGLNFVFGEADARTRKALISLKRLKPEFYGRKPNEVLFQTRILKEAVHELGHTYRLPHCPNKKCVMYFSNTIQDTDRKGHLFCPVCQYRLSQAQKKIARMRAGTD